MLLDVIGYAAKLPSSPKFRLMTASSPALPVQQPTPHFPPATPAMLERMKDSFFGRKFIQAKLLGEAKRSDGLQPIQTNAR